MAFAAYPVVLMRFSWPSLACSNSHTHTLSSDTEQNFVSEGGSIEYFVKNVTFSKYSQAHCLQLFTVDQFEGGETAGVFSDKNLPKLYNFATAPPDSPVLPNANIDFTL